LLFIHKEKPFDKPSNVGYTFPGTAPLARRPEKNGRATIDYGNATRKTLNTRILSHHRRAVKWKIRKKKKKFVP
jgi:hypothetical protein